MKRASTQFLRTTNISFVLLWLIVAALGLYVTHTYRFTADWTQNGRNSLAAPSLAITRALKGPVTIEAFATTAGTTRHTIRLLIGQYQRAYPHIALRFIDPNKHPTIIREDGVSYQGELRITYDHRHSMVLSPTQTGITNALARLERTGVRQITFLLGNKEQSPADTTGLGLSAWAHQLRASGFTVTTLNLLQSASLKNTGILVIADPQTRFLPGQIQTLQNYVAQGGDLLWLLAPQQTAGLRPLAHSLGIRIPKGFVVDPTSTLLTGASPALIAIDRYPANGPVRGMHLVTVLPGATALTIEPTSPFTTAPILRTDRTAWQQTGPLTGVIQRGRGDTPGPLTVGVTLTRLQNKHTQRIVIIGSSDFCANNFLGEGGNLTLAMNLANWITHDTAFINIPNRPSPDLSLTLTQHEEDAIAFGFLLILPLLFILISVTIWWRRRSL